MSLLEFVAKIVLRILYRVKIEGLQKLDFTGRTLIMPNHVSLIDAVVLALYLPKAATFVVNTQIARKYAFFLRRRKHITVDPMNPYSVRQMVRVVNSGEPLVIFPEGRITVTGGLMKIYNGVGYIALKTGAKVYPVAIEGAERTKFGYIGGKIKTHWFTPVSLSIGEPFVIPWDRSRLLRKQKEAAAFRIQRELQEQLFKRRMKSGVNLFNELLDASRLHGAGMPICQDISQKITYKQLILAVYVLSRKLRLMLGGEAFVGLLLPNSVGHVIALFSCFYSGQTPAILNFSAGKQNVLDACETADLQTVITSRLFVEKAKLEPLIEALSERVAIVYLEDVKAQIGTADKLSGLWKYWTRARSSAVNNQLVLFTSGSESKPKGVVLTHDNVYANIAQGRSVIDFTSQDRMLNALPMFHSFGLTAGTILPIVCGMSVYLYPSPLHYKVIPELVYDWRATILFGTSTFLSGYGRMAHPYDFSSVRYVFAGAEKLKDDVRDMWMDKFGIRIFEGYGITETAPILALNTPLAYKRGTVGQLLPGIQALLETVDGIDSGGNLLVRGPNVMKGYLLHGQGFVPAKEWYETGDIVDIDDQGYVTITSRLKRFAKIGGEMISLNQVEELAEACFGHDMFAAVSVPDPRKGERILLFTTDAHANKEALSAYLQQQGYSSLWIPARVAAVPSIPLLGSGKTDYVSLKAQAQQLI